MEPANQTSGKEGESPIGFDRPGGRGDLVRASLFEEESVSAGEPERVTDRLRGGPKQILELALAAAGTVFLMFLAWEGVEQSRAMAPDVVRLIHYARGVSTSLLVAGVVGWLSMRQRQSRDAELESELERRARESDRARRLLKLIVDTTPASLVVLDDQNRIVQTNRTAERVHGGGISGAHCHDALKCDTVDCTACFVNESLRRGESVRAPRLHRDERTGEILEVESHPLNLHDGQTYALLVENIVTERKKLEARVLHQEKMAAFGLFAAEVAHDLGNPLCSIDSQLQLVDDEQLPVDARDAIVLVRREVRRLHRVLRELVSFARKRREEATLVSVTGVVEDALRLIRHDRRMREVRVVRSFAPDVPPVHLVEDHLMQVVMNLLMNALDAMPEGGLLRLEVHARGRGVCLRVRDSGVGMEPETLARCLEPLFTTKEEGKGTGLGLSIARDILRAADGDIEMHSSVGRGTMALVTLPVPTSSGQTESGDRETLRSEAVAAEGGGRR